jgi:hypothetical protein
MEAAHLGVQTGFIQEDEAAMIPLQTLLAPEQARFYNVRTILLGGAQGFF